MITESDIRTTYNRFDAMTAFDSSNIEVLISKRMTKTWGRLTTLREKHPDGSITLTPKKIVIASHLTKFDDKLWLTAKRLYASAAATMITQNNQRRSLTYRGICCIINCDPDAPIETNATHFAEQTKHAKYRFHCNNCRNSIYYYRRSNAIKDAEDGYIGACSVCGSTNVNIEIPDGQGNWITKFDTWSVS